MPKTIKRKTAARKPRKGIDRRDHRKKPGCKVGDRTKASAPKVIANSIFALTLAAKPGLEVINKVDKGHLQNRDDDDYYKMCNDLLKSFFHANRMLNNSVSSFNPLANGFEIGRALSYVINVFEQNILPKGWKYNIDLDEGQSYYHFTIYKECEFRCAWHSFEIKPIVCFLSKKYPALHNLFIEFIAAFMRSTEIYPWWGGGLNYADYTLEDRVENWEHERFEDEDESWNELALVKATIESYNTGEVKRYENMIRNTKHRKPANFEKKLNAFRYRQPIIKEIICWMKEALAFMQKPGCMSDYTYEPVPDMEGLKFDLQAAIIWDEDDPYSREELECLDSEAQSCGVYSPTYHFGVFKKERFENLDEKLKWPQELTKINRSYAMITEKLKKSNEQQDRNFNEHIQASAIRCRV